MELVLSPGDVKHNVPGLFKLTSPETCIAAAVMNAMCWRHEHV